MADMTNEEWADLRSRLHATRMARHLTRGPNYAAALSEIGERAGASLETI